MREKDLFDSNIRYFLKIVLKYRYHLLASVVAGACIGFIVSKYLIRPVYQAKTSLFVGLNTEDNRSNMKDVYSGILLGSQLVNDYKELITSKRIERMVSDEIRTKKLLEMEPEYKANVLLKRNTRVVVISVNSTSPKTAEVVANITAKVFISMAKEIMKLKNVQVIDRASLPRKYIKPLKRNYVAGGAFLAFLLAFALTSLREFFDRTIKNPDEVTEKLQLPVFGVIANMGQDKKSKKIKANDRIGIVVLKDDRSQNSESFRMLRTNLHYSITDGADARIFMVTSSTPSEGKSMVVSNLAVVMADSNKKVLLIDCDLRKPVQHRIFNTPRTPGLVNYLAGDATYEDVILKNTMGSSLDLMMSGPIPPNPTELLMSDKFKNLLKQATAEYDYVFLDTPPCLYMADAAILGRLADRLLFTITANRTREDFIKRSISQLKQIGINVTGIVLNRFSSKGSGDSYYAYNYHHHYGKAAETECLVVDNS